jgi:hypothetical protein
MTNLSCTIAALIFVCGFGSGVLAAIGAHTVLGWRIDEMAHRRDDDFSGR